VGLDKDQRFSVDWLAVLMEELFTPRTQPLISTIPLSPAILPQALARTGKALVVGVWWRHFCPKWCGELYWMYLRHKHGQQQRCDQDLCRFCLRWCHLQLCVIVGFAIQLLGQSGQRRLGGWGVGEGSGGAIFNGSSLFLSGNTFAQNAVVGGNGATLLVGGNTPGGAGQGGAICNQGTLLATNCSFVENAAEGGAPGDGYPYEPASGGDSMGGGLFNSGTATLVNLTFATNNAIGGAGSIDPTHAYPPGADGLSLGGSVCNSNGTVNLYNTIVAYSTSGSNCWGTIADLGYNLSSDASAGFSAAGSLNNTDPKLGPLGNYGGPP